MSCSRFFRSAAAEAAAVDLAAEQRAGAAADQYARRVGIAAIELAAEVGPSMGRHVERMANSALMLNPAYLEGMERYLKGIGGKKD